MTFQYFGWNLKHQVLYHYICPNCRDQSRRCTYFGTKLSFVAGIFLWKYSWCMKIYFQFHFFVIWSISTSILSKIVRKAQIPRPWYRCFPVNFTKLCRTPLVAASAITSMLTRIVTKHLIYNICSTSLNYNIYTASLAGVKVKMTDFLWSAW